MPFGDDPFDVKPGEFPNHYCVIVHRKLFKLPNSYATAVITNSKGKATVVYIKHSDVNVNTTVLAMKINSIAIENRPAFEKDMNLYANFELEYKPFSWVQIVSTNDPVAILKLKKFKKAHHYRVSTFELRSKTGSLSEIHNALESLKCLK